MARNRKNKPTMYSFFKNTTKLEQKVIGQDGLISNLNCTIQQLNRLAHVNYLIKHWLVLIIFFPYSVQYLYKYICSFCCLLVVLHWFTTYKDMVKCQSLLFIRYCVVCFIWDLPSYKLTKHIAYKSPHLIRYLN